MAASLCGAVPRHPLNESKFRKNPVYSAADQAKAVRLSPRVGSDDEIRQQPLREPSDSYSTPLSIASQAKPSLEPHRLRKIEVNLDASIFQEGIQ